jgi:hypothetical protein
MSTHFRYLYGHRAVIRHYLGSGWGNIMLACVITICDADVLGFWFGDGGFSLCLSLLLLSVCLSLSLCLSLPLSLPVWLVTSYGKYFRYPFTFYLFVGGICFFSALVLYCMLCSRSSENCVFFFWIQDWCCESGRAIVDCRYTFGYSKVIIIRLYSSNVKGNCLHRFYI